MLQCCCSNFCMVHLAAARTRTRRDIHSERFEIAMMHALNCCSDARDSYGVLRTRNTIIRARPQERRRGGTRRRRGRGAGMVREDGLRRAVVWLPSAGPSASSAEGPRGTRSPPRWADLVPPCPDLCCSDHASDRGGGRRWGCQRG
jgi:hypothetical protein